MFLPETIDNHNRFVRPKSAPKVPALRFRRLADEALAGDDNFPPAPTDHAYPPA